MTNDLETTLDALVVDAPVDRADWSDVTRRARRPQRRRALVLAIVAVMTTIAVVTPAFGLGSRMLDLFEGTPASPEVQQLFADWNSRSTEWGATLGRVPPANVEAAKAWLAQNFPRVDARKAHGLFSVELSPSVVLQLWAAPIDGGGVCSILLRADQVADVHASGGRTSCITPTTTVAPRGWGTMGFGVPGRGLKLGTAPGAASVELRFADGTSLRAPVVEGFYLAPVNNPRIGNGPSMSRYRTPPLGVMETQIISYDARGNQLAEATSDQKVIADYLGITVADLWTTDRPSYDVKSDGNTLAKMATDRGKSVSGLVDAIAAHWKLRLDAQVAAGLVAAEDAASRLADRWEAADAMVHGVPPPGFDSNYIPLPPAQPPQATPSTAAPNVSIVSVRTVFPLQSRGDHPLAVSPGSRPNVVTAGSSMLVLEVTIHNGGDARETEVPVTLTIVRDERFGDPIERTVTVDAIAANETTTTAVTFNGLDNVPFAVPLALWATVANGPVQVYPIFFSLPG